MTTRFEITLSLISIGHNDGRFVLLGASLTSDNPLIPVSCLVAVNKRGSIKIDIPFNLTDGIFDFEHCSPRLEFNDAERRCLNNRAAEIRQIILSYMNRGDFKLRRIAELVRHCIKLETQLEVARQTLAQQLAELPNEVVI